MCGRIVRVWDPKLQKWVVKSDAFPGHEEVRREVLLSRYNIAPVTPLLIALAPDSPLARNPSSLEPSGSGPRLEVARWGFQLPNSGTIFNTRREDAGDSRLWGPLVDAHHAVVPATGFYEWMTRGPSRVPHFIQRSDGEPMFFAAVVGEREAEGRMRLCASVVTCPSVGAVAELHDRMPVILEEGDIEEWLGASEGTFERLAKESEVLLRVHEVASKVNKAAGVDGPELILPVARQARLG